MRDRTMFFTPPELSDEAAYGVVEFFQILAMAFETHYMAQLRRYTKKLDEENNFEIDFEEDGTDYPF